MHEKAKTLASNPDLVTALDNMDAIGVDPKRIDTARRRFVIQELLKDDPELTREAAEALYDEAPDDAGPSKIRIELSEATVALFQKLAALPFGIGAWQVKADGGKPLLYGCGSLLAYGTIATWDELALIASIINDLQGKVPEAHVDDLAVDRFAGFMKRKLARKRKDGRSGWNDEEQCSIEDLSRMLIEHVHKGDPLDVCNFAMMIHHRDGRIIEPPAQPIETAPANTHVLVWWPRMKIGEDGEITNEVAGGEWLVSEKQGDGDWLDPDVLNGLNNFLFGDEQEYALDPTAWKPLPGPLFVAEEDR